MISIDPTDRHLDLVPQGSVLIYSLATRAGDQNKNSLRWCELTVSQHLAAGLEPVQDSLGVVESVNAEQDQFRIADCARISQARAWTASVRA